MIRSYRLSELTEVLGGSLLAEDVAISGISIDSRSIQPGDLFIAIRGPRFDGHAYLEKAMAAGAVAVLIDEAVENLFKDSDQGDVNVRSIPGIRVADTFKALGQLGRFNREHYKNPLVAITGSCGKTSVKEMLASICNEVELALATEGNLNNAFGAPLTLSRLDADHGFAVVELGTSSPGEIAYISELSQPDVSVITNAAETHLDELVSVEGVAHEKGFILDFLKPAGTAVLNRDDRFYQQWCERALKENRKLLSFSLNNPEADCYATGVKSTGQGMEFCLHLGEQEVNLCIAFWGQHQVQNACCAAAAAKAVGIGLDDIVRGLENARPFQRRGQRYQLSEQTLLIDETYNANPKATLAAIDQLTDCDGRTIMVLGDMLDLGGIAEPRHREIGKYARRQGVDYFAGYGAMSRLAVAEFGDNARHFDDKEALTRWLSGLLEPSAASAAETEGTTVLVKGSRGMEMLDIVRSLVGPKYKGER